MRTSDFRPVDREEFDEDELRLFFHFPKPRFVNAILCDDLTLDELEDSAFCNVISEFCTTYYLDSVLSDR